MRNVVKAVTVLVLWFLLAALGALAPVVGLLFALGGNSTQTGRIMRATNRHFASMLGWDGTHGVSHECGDSRGLFCKLLCPVLSVLLNDPDHCRRERERG